MILVSGLDVFTPIRIGPHVAPSRIFLAPINTGYGVMGRPSPSLIKFHLDRSNPSIGVSMVGNVAVMSSGATNGGTLLLDSGEAMEAIKPLSRLISERGSLPGIQLAYSPPGLAASRNWVAKDLRTERHRLTALLTATTDGELSRIADAFVRPSLLRMPVFKSSSFTARMVTCYPCWPALSSTGERGNTASRAHGLFVCWRRLSRKRAHVRSP